MSGSLKCTFFFPTTESSVLATGRYVLFCIVCEMYRHFIHVYCIGVSWLESCLPPPCFIHLKVRIKWNRQFQWVNLSLTRLLHPVAFECHISWDAEHQLNFSGTAAAQRRLMRVRYAEAIGGGLIDDWSLSVRQSLGSQLSLAYISG